MASMPVTSGAGTSSRATRNALTHGDSITGGFPLGLTPTNLRLGLIHLSSRLPWNDPIPQIGSPVPEWVLALANIVNTCQVTIMWTNPYQVRRPDHRFYSDMGFYQMPNGQWLIFDLVSGKRVQFDIQFRESPGVESLAGMGSYDVGWVVPRQQIGAQPVVPYEAQGQSDGGRSQVPPGAAPAGSQPPNQGGGLGTPLKVEEQHTNTAARPNSGPTFEPHSRSRHIAGRPAGFPPPSSPQMQPLFQPANSPVHEEDDILDVLRLNANAGRLPRQHVATSGQSTALRPQAFAEQQPNDHHEKKAFTTANVDNSMVAPMPKSPPPKHPTNPRKRLKVDRYIYPKGHEFYGLNFPLPNTQYDEDDWYDDVAGDEDDCQVLASAPAECQGKDSKKKRKRNSPAAARPDMIKVASPRHQEPEEADAILDEDGYPVDVAHVANVKPPMTTISTAADITNSPKPKPIKTKEPNKTPKASQRQQPITKDIAKPRASPNTKTDAPQADARQVDKTLSNHSVAAAHAPRSGAIQQAVNHSSFDNLPPGLLPYHEAQRRRDQARLQAQETKERRAQDRATVKQSSGQTAEQPNTGEKRGREDESNEDKFGKRQRNAEHAQYQQLSGKSPVLDANRESFSNIAKSYVTGVSPSPPVPPSSQGSTYCHPWGAQQRQGHVGAAAQSNVQKLAVPQSVQAPQVSAVISSSGTTPSTPALLSVQDAAIPQLMDPSLGLPYNSAENNWQHDGIEWPLEILPGIDFPIDEKELRASMEYTDALFASKAPKTDNTLTTPLAPQIPHLSLPSSSPPPLPSRPDAKNFDIQAATEEERAMGTIGTPLSEGTWLTPPASAYPPPGLPSPQKTKGGKRPYRKRSPYWTTKGSHVDEPDEEHPSKKRRSRGNETSKGAPGFPTTDKKLSEIRKKIDKKGEASGIPNPSSKPSPGASPLAGQAVEDVISAPASTEDPPTTIDGNSSGDELEALYQETMAQGVAGAPSDQPPPSPGIPGAQP
ncbi:MAG: hypothetical protein Q9225_002475 [Loekoesia sp. 1 TL-2023]